MHYNYGVYAEINGNKNITELYLRNCLSEILFIIYVIS